MPKQKDTRKECHIREGYSLKQRYARLPLMSELNALCAAYANPRTLRCSVRDRPSMPKQKDTPCECPFVLAQREGFEPYKNLAFSKVF